MYIHTPIHVTSGFHTIPGNDIGREQFIPAVRLDWNYHMDSVSNPLIYGFSEEKITQLYVRSNIENN